MWLKLFTGTAIAAFSVTAAPAADLMRSAPVPAAMPALLPAYNWGGFYVGGALGLGSQRTKWTDVDDWYGGDTYKLKNSGFVLGAYAGYNFLVSPQFLVGIETDIARTFGDDRVTVDAEEPAYITSDANWLGSTRLRAGWVLDRTLIYATGGVAYGDPSARWHEASGAAWKVDGWRAGYTLGAGVEYAATNNWLVRLEGLYYNLGSLDAKDVTPASSFDSGYTGDHRQRVKLDGFTVRAGIAYKF
jgi:outer membrane immunogenic protein